MNLAAKMSKALAIALMFWCAGAGCMMVSYAQGAMREMDSSDGMDMSSMTHMSGSMDAHACCKAKRKNARRSQAVSQSKFSEFKEFTVPAPAQSAAMSCCPLTSGSIIFASRSNGNDDASVLSNTDSSTCKLSSSNQKPVTPPLRLPNRAHSYLLDCAFLI